MPLTPEELREVQKDDIADLLGDGPVGGEVEPIEPVVPIEPVEPIEPTEPIVPVEPTVPVEPIVEPAPDVYELPEVLPTDPVELTKLLRSFAAQTAGLRTTVNEMAQGGPATAPIVPAAPPVPSVAPKDAVHRLQEMISNPEAFLTKEELDQVIDNPALINTAIQRSMERMANAFVETLPSLTGEFVKQHTAVQTVVDKFYVDNKDLIPFKNYAMVVSREIASDPKISVADMLNKTAVEVRKRLRLPAPMAIGVKPASTPGPVIRVTKPAFAQQRRTAVTPISPASKLSDQRSQIKDLLS